MPERAAPPLRHFLLTVAYDGGDFHGWQRQPADRSVQGELEAAAGRIVAAPVVVRGAGRTDAGVHARGQVAAFSAATRLDATAMRRALHSLLPDSIRIVAAAETPAPVDPRRSARRKTYVYQFHLGDHLPPDRRRHFVLAGRSLDVAAMRRAAALLEGEHDFSSFARASAAAGRGDPPPLRHRPRPLYNMRNARFGAARGGRGCRGPDGEIKSGRCLRGREGPPARAGDAPPEGLFSAGRPRAGREPCKRCRERVDLDSNSLTPQAPWQQAPHPVLRH